MPITELPGKEHLPAVKQKTDNCCWAACGMALSHYYKNHHKIGTARDQDKIAELLKKSLTEIASVEDVLAALGLVKAANEIDVDANPLPTSDEIQKEIKAGKPLVVGIHDTTPLKDPKADPLVGGHYMIIVAVDIDTGKLSIMDPATGTVFNAGRDKYTNSRDAYYCKTFYLDKPDKP